DGVFQTNLVLRALEPALRVEAPLRQVVRRGQAEHLLQLRRPPRRIRSQGQGRLFLGGGAGRGSPRDHVWPAPEGRRALRQRLEEARRQERYSRRDLYGND